MRNLEATESLVTSHISHITSLHGRENCRIIMDKCIAKYSKQDSGSFWKTVPFFLRAGDRESAFFPHLLLHDLAIEVSKHHVAGAWLPTYLSKYIYIYTNIYTAYIYIYTYIHIYIYIHIIYTYIVYIHVTWAMILVSK